MTHFEHQAIELTEQEVRYHYAVATGKEAGARTLMAARRQDFAGLEMAKATDACDSRSRLLRAMVPAILGAARQHVARCGGTLEAATEHFLHVANLAIR